MERVFDQYDLTFVGFDEGFMLLPDCLPGDVVSKCHSKYIIQHQRENRKAVSIKLGV